METWLQPFDQNLEEERYEAKRFESWLQPFDQDLEEEIYEAEHGGPGEEQAKPRDWVDQSRDHAEQHGGGGLAIPEPPSDEERRRHELTHADPQPWCPACVAGKPHGPSHVKTDPTVKTGNVIQLDYTHWSGTGIPGAGVDRRALTSLSAVHESTSHCMAMAVERKGAWPFAVVVVIRLPHPKRVAPGTKYGIQSFVLQYCSQLT